MIYTYDKKSREFRKVNFSKHVSKFIFVTSITLTLGAVSQVNRVNSMDYTESEIEVIISKYNEFTEDKLVQRIKELNFKFPHIVLAQAKLETGNFTSKMFNENNNLFGMKQARQRINTAGGTQHGHAYYDTWLESVYDYAFYSSTYLHKIKNERDYFNYLSHSYAEDPNYIVNLQNIIEKENLKSKF
jgi:uncharacterized FlgJ-related protein